MKKIILALASLTVLVGQAFAAGVLINGNQINPQTAISISTLTVTGATGLTVTSNITGPGTGLTGTAAGLTAGNAAKVVTNANLTGDVTSVGNATTVVNASGGFTVVGQESVVSTMTVLGNAFSVGGSSFTVGGGSATVAYSLTAGSFTGVGSSLTRTYNIQFSSIATGGTFTTTSASYVVVTGSTVTITTTGSDPALLAFSGNCSDSTVSTANFAILQDSVLKEPLGAGVGFIQSTSLDAAVKTCVQSYWATLSAGSHTFAIMVKVNGGTESLTGWMLTVEELKR